MEKPPENNKEIGNEYNVTFRGLFPGKTYLFTPLLIYVNSLVFLLMVASGGNLFDTEVDSLIRWGGNLRSLTIGGEPWRLITSVFLHSGIIHLAFNIYILIYIGSVLEKAIGKKRFILAYIFSGTLSSVFSLIFNENIVSVGASGAIFGIIGVLGIQLILKRISIPSATMKNMALSAGFFIFYNVIYAIRLEGIDHVAHLGGLISGGTIGAIYSLDRVKKINPVFTYIILGVFFCTSLIIGLSSVSDTLGRYEAAMYEFSSNEKKTLWAFEKDISLHINQEQLRLNKERIHDEGIFLWQRNEEIISDLLTANYPEQLQNHLRKLLEYSQLRKNYFKTLVDLIDVDTPEARLHLDTTTQNIARILSQMEEMNRQW
ncbi:rhomboid family intramembrane serine protease [Chitinispirillales bacterium ANBcel5]|uniref:rhomboid family intramembrane serine protease n=1 Tax=Cellulosispirillum alkaliphilum TaxID=3039283 RepID=UPI002A551201|nr:rhomboid family intramembrane serine protease [Chitinispirillales bacterium ANBcel5]